MKLAFQGSAISSDGGLLLYRELDDALGLSDLAARMLADPRTGKKRRHHLGGLVRQSIFCVWPVTRTSTTPIVCA